MIKIIVSFLIFTFLGCASSADKPNTSIVVSPPATALTDEELIDIVFHKI